MKKKIYLLIATLFLLPAIHVSSQDWAVPEDESAVENPVKYELDNVLSGKDLYMANCKSCHGDPGKNNPLPLVPLPPDVDSEKMQANSDGALFYKITSGKGAMPQFETVLSEDERWKIINFINNYNPKRTALIIVVPPIKAQIWASVNEEDASIEVFIEGEDKNGAMQNLANVPVIISAKKTFGNMEIGEVVTNEDGRSKFFVPESLIGDEEGLVNMVVSLNEDYEAKVVVLENAKIATQKHVTKLIKPGVIWSTNDNMPLWLMASFIGLVLAAWITIGYVIMQIVKIKRLSK